MMDSATIAACHCEQLAVQVLMLDRALGLETQIFVFGDGRVFVSEHGSFQTCAATMPPLAQYSLKEEPNHVET